ncbi:hypothetical protein Vau01_043020 [Virgisporangium aurantiacum]|uniref:Uncharacterized protein n=2 Tax=Virgisporangium aurantiacum TaxID=175570 RepID=A0A8J4E0G5_9ACTN|nr:hypothetical protein Vau01_043020 [Virgisporangium aurantiacum]
MRRFSANDVLDGHINFRAYPHRYLFVYGDARGKENRFVMPRLLAAVEALESQAWELVNVLGNNGNFFAVMRRPDTPPTP